MTTSANLEITGSNEGLLRVLNESKLAVQSAFVQMKEAADGLKGAFESINVALIGLTAVLAGGKAFKEAVAASQEAALSAQSMGKQLGITASQASVLRSAMASLSVPTEAVTTAAQKIAQTVAKNPQEFERMGVAIRDSNGNMRDSLAIMTDVNTHLAALHEGTTRNAEGVAIYGRSWPQVAITLRLTNEAMAEAEERSKALGLYIGQEGVAQAVAYRSAMANLGEDFDGIKKAIGDALIPVLTKLAQWFDSIGPAAVTVMRGTMQVFGTILSSIAQVVQALWNVFVDAAKAIGEVISANFGGATLNVLELFINAIKVVEVAFIGIRVVVQEVAAVVGGAFRLMGENASLFATVIGKALSFDFAGAKQAWIEGSAAMEQTAKQTWAKMVQDATQGASDINTAIMGDLGTAGPQTATKDSGGSKQHDDVDKERVAKWQAALDQKRVLDEQDAAAHGQLLEWTKQQDIDYWNSIIQGYNLSGAERRAIDEKIAKDQEAINRQNIEAFLATEKNKITAAGDSLSGRLAAERKYAEDVKGIYRENSAQYAEAQRQILATENEMARQKLAIAELEVQFSRQTALAEIQNEEAAAKERYQIGAISLQQLIQLERQYEAQRFALEEQGLNEQLAMMDPQTVKYAETLKKMETLALQHNQVMLKITQQEATQQQQITKRLTDALANGFTQAFQGIIRGTQTVGQAFKSIFSSILDVVTSTIAQLIAQYIKQQIVSMALSKSTQTQKAGEAATSAGASAAQIPYVGWILAIGAMASVFAAAVSYKAEGGFDVPAGMMPQTTLHPREMVLPAHLADRVRAVTPEPGGGGGGGSGGISLHVKATDSKSFGQQLRRGGTLERALRDFHRRGIGRR